MWGTFSWGRLRCRLRGAGILLFSVTAGAAGAANAVESLSLADAIDRALAGNPELALAGYEREIQEGLLLQSTLKPNPLLDLQVENFLGTDAYRGADGAETTLSLVWLLERGKRAYRKAVAEAGLEQVSVQTRIRRIDVAATTAMAFLDVLRDQERLRLAQEGVLLGEQMVTAVAERVRIGRSPDLELKGAEADLAWLRLDLEDVEHELLVSRRLLAATWGVNSVDFSAAAGDIADLPEAGTYAELVARASAGPMINQYLTRRRVRDAELRLAEVEAKQDWRLQTGARHLNLSNDVAFVAGISIPLGFNDQNQGQIAAARARAAMTDGELLASRVRIETALFRLHQELSHNIHRSHAMRDEVLPRLDSVVADSREAYTAGRFSYLALRQAQADLLAVRQAYLEENFEAQANRIAIERLTGTALGVTEGESL